MKHLVVYSADLHGNEAQYKKLVDFANHVSADSLIIGGDIAPKRARREDFISAQRKFLSDKLPSFFEPFKKELPDSQVYLMMGNDDCVCNLDVLGRYDNNLFHIIHARRLRLTEDLDIVGYSCVPITPFMLKDWERFDLGEVPEALATEYVERKSWNYRLQGFKSTRNDWRPFQFTEAMEKEESIQKDLREGLYTKNPEKTVYVFHAPPDGTNLDQRYDGRHVGSMAGKLFIENYQPYLTLHGHIHETVDVSGSFKDHIGTSMCLSAGNHDLGNYSEDDLSVLLFDLLDIKKAQRKIV